MIVKITAQYSDGQTHDFLSVEDFLGMVETPHLHPDVALTGTQPPVEVVEPAQEAPVEESTEPVAPAPEG